MRTSLRPGTLALVSLLVASAGCFRDNRVQRDDKNANPFSEVPKVLAPATDRCAQHGKSSARASCDEARYLGQNYVRALSVGDEVCLEGGFGESAGGACLARAAVADAGSGELLIEVRDAQPTSRWHNHVMNQVWYEEGALVDLYLAERGY